MAGQPLAYSSTLVELGPGTAWANTELPATGSRPTIAANAAGDLTPDATTSPSAIHIGFTQEGSKVLYKPEITEHVADESTTPVISALTGEPSNIQGTWWQILDMATMLKMMAGGTRTTGAGFDQITWGGKQTIVTFPVMVIAPIYADPTKIVVVMLYKAYNRAGFDFGISRKAISASPFDFQAQEISSRPVGDRTGIIYKTT